MRRLSIGRPKDLPPGVVGVRAVGVVSKSDYERTFPPILNEARRFGNRIRFLYELGPEFEGFTPVGNRSSRALVANFPIQAVFFEISVADCGEF